MSVLITSVLMALCLTVGSVPTKGEEAKMTGRASGTFEVEIEPIPQEARFPRLALKKRFSGELEGTSEGEMMSVEGEVKGSGAYVAIERIRGTLAGRTGTFSVIHNGTMQQGADFELRIRVVPDSGTEELTGIAGTMEILIEEGRHSYNLDYTLPRVP